MRALAKIGMAGLVGTAMLLPSHAAQAQDRKPGAALPEFSSADKAPTPGWEYPTWQEQSAESRVPRTPSVLPLPTVNGRFRNAKAGTGQTEQPSLLLTRLGQNRITYHVLDQSLEHAFREVGQLVGASVIPGNGVRGAIRNRRFEGSAAEVLDAMAKEQNLMWFSDGSAIYVEPVEDSRSRTFRVKDLKRDQIDSAMATAGLDRHRHRIQFAPNDSAVRAYGPESFLKVVEGVLAGVQPEAEPDINMIKFGRRAEK